MAGRPPKTPNIPEQGEAPEVQYYDKFVVAVKREGQLAPDGSLKGRTKSVQIRELIRGKMPCAEVTINALNATVEHQNPTDQGMPVIHWYFPHGRVKEGEQYLATDLFREVEQTDEYGEATMVKTKDIKGLSIFLDKKIIGFDGKKPIFETKVKKSEIIEQ